MTVYYNEFEPKTAAWLRELIRQGHIAPGVVDERSIEDVRPSDLRGFTQCHFFAGVGVWSYALRRSGWADDRPIWTGSCPCQPFSAAGKGAAFADERHLWPAFHHLIAQCKPAGILGEQVASSAVDAWIDLVHADLEALGYAFGSVPFPSAGVGAPHIRDRNYWVANAGGKGLEKRIGIAGIPGGSAGGGARQAAFGAGVRDVGGLADTRGRSDRAQEQAASHGQPQANRSSDQLGGCGVPPGGLADYELQQRPHGQPGISLVDAEGGRLESAAAPAGLRGDMPPGQTNGYWRDADWLGCRDGKWRPVEPGTFPLANGASARVVRLRGYGNAINAEAAKAWVETVMECLP